MQHKKVTTSDGNVIHIYDDVFSVPEREHHSSYCYGSKYKFYTQTTFLSKDVQHFLKCHLTEDELNQFQFFTNNNVEDIVHDLVGRHSSIEDCWIIASTSAPSGHMFHVDSQLVNDQSKVILYHVNTQWDKNWHGETLFANSSGECELAIEYKPGRVIVYDSTSVHASAPVTSQLNQIRFIFAAALSSVSITE